LALLAAGAAIGLLARLLGIGGGVIAVPVPLDVLAGRPDAAAVAIGTEHAAVLLAALPGVAVFALAGQVASLPLLLLVAPAFVVGPWAARLSRRLDPALLRPWRLAG
jgi:uncharacterized membrane protein YfcA